jgi:hypothetical protein
MHSSANFFFEAKLRVNIFKRDIVVAGKFVSRVISIERYVVEPVLLTFGRLPVFWQKLHVLVIPLILDVMDIKT